MKISRKALVFAITLAALHESAGAAGFALIENSASGMGSAFAGAAAIGEDASTVWFNPAGMVRLDKQQVAGALHAVLPEASYRDEGSYINPALTGDSVTPGSLSGSNDKTDVIGIVPNLYYVLPFAERYTFGIGLNAPFGLETDYEDDWVGRYHGTNSSLMTININPSLAWQANDALSFGVGISVQYVEADLSNQIDSGAVCLRVAGDSNELLAQCLDAGLLPNTVENDSSANVKGDDWSYGFNLGLLYQFNESSRIGLAYRSEVDHRLEGDGEFEVNPALRSILDSVGLNTLFTNTSVTATADLPASASLSAVLGVSDRLTLLADITWTGWSSFDELRIKFDNPAQADAVTDESWDDSMRYSVGLNYREGKRIWRAGWAYDETPIPDAEHRTPRIPGNDRTWLAFGVGMPFFEAFWLDLGYAHLFIDDTAIDHTDSNGYTLRGVYEAEVDIFSVQATMEF
ncbi:MAG: outer membrane protein transport protein [Gammaproteobacteria bacterium]|nr:outer membrane protein transport protein [Gammaproteobacteria bacterium]